MGINLEVTKKRRITELIIAVCVIALFAFVYLGILGVYDSENVASTSAFSVGDSNGENRVDISAKLMSIDPVKGDLIVRLQFAPAGEYLGDDGTNLSEDLVLSVNSSTGKEETVFKKGDRMNPMDITLSLDGTASDYPFDSELTALAINLTKPVVEEDEVDGVKTTLTNYEDVSVSVSYTGALTGYKIEASEAAEKVEGISEIDMVVSRSSSVQTFAVFVMILQWALALSALFAALSIIVRKRKIEFGMLSWLGALLFALPPLRNAMPYVPPIGTQSDFMSFFWAEAFVALSLVSIVVTWLIRRPNK